MSAPTLRLTAPPAVERRAATTAPVTHVDTRTVPLALPYPDGRVERVERVVSAEAAS